MEGVFGRKGCHVFAVSRYYLGIPELAHLRLREISFLLSLRAKRRISLSFSLLAKTEERFFASLRNDKILRPSANPGMFVRRATNVVAYASFSISALNSAVTPWTQLDSHGSLAQNLDGFLELNAALVDLEALRLKRVGKITGSHRSRRAGRFLPAFRRNFTVTWLSRAACCWAASFSVAVSLASVMRIFSRRLMLAGRRPPAPACAAADSIARVAAATSTTSPRGSELFNVFLQNNLHGIPLPEMFSRLGASLNFKIFKTEDTEKRGENLRKPFSLFSNSPATGKK